MTGSEVAKDLLVVGGGVIGLASARESALRGLRVAVFDRGLPGRGSTWAAAGMLSPASESLDSEPFLRFGLDSLSMYPEWAQSLVSDSNLTFGFRKGEKLHLAGSEAESKRLAEMGTRATASGISAEWITPVKLRAMEPTVSPSFLGGLLVHDDYRLDNRKLVDALLGSCREAGVEVHPEVPVESIRIEAGKAVGVTLGDGDQVDGGAVLIAAGAWSRCLPGLPRALGVRPMRGQMLALDPEGRMSDRVLESEGIYLVPREGGRLLVGATVEDTGFEAGTTAGGIHGLLDAAIRMVPGLRSAPIRESWSGLRPGTEDGEPIIGPDPDVERLFYATGHFRNGILLAPLTARIIADLVAGHATEIPVQFAPGRWGAGSPKA